jgi:hypothetical protein
MNNVKWTRAFWKGLFERAVRAFIAAFLGTLALPQIWAAILNHTFRLSDVGWQGALLAGLGAAIVSILMSLGINGINLGPTGSASAVYDRPRDVGVRPSDGS